MIHDLAPEGAEILSGHFTPAGNRVVVDVQAAYSYDQDRKPADVAGTPVSTGESPTHVAADNAYVVVSNVDAATNHVSILSAATHALVPIIPRFGWIGSIMNCGRQLGRFLGCHST